MMLSEMSRLEMMGVVRSELALLDSRDRVRILAGLLWEEASCGSGGSFLSSPLGQSCSFRGSTKLFPFVPSSPGPLSPHIHLALGVLDGRGGRAVKIHLCEKVARSEYDLVSAEDSLGMALYDEWRRGLRFRWKGRDIPVKVSGGIGDSCYVEYEG